LRTLTRNDLYDYLIGSAILSCGHSEDSPNILALVENIVEKGLKIRLVDPKDIPDDNMICTASFQGGGGVPMEVRDLLAPYQTMIESTDPTEMLKKAVTELSNHIKEEFYSFMCICTSPFQCTFPMYLSALEEKPFIDGDCCGRARPGVYLSLTNVAKIPLTPMVIVTPLGETLILKERAPDLPRTGDLIKFIHMASGGRSTAIASSPASIVDYRRGMIPYQVSRCIDIGNAIRNARKRGGDPVQAFMEKSSALKIFCGEIKSVEREERLGYSWGEWLIKGSGEFEGHNLRVWWKNENMISWLDDKPYVTCPDLICIVDNKDCKGLGLFPQNIGKKVTVFGLPAHDLWRTGDGIELWSPRRYKFDIEYESLESRVKTRLMNN